jgi:predicted metal-dependent TIM-barrel fold hydrolase
MRYFDPHIHMLSRTTDDYEAMYLAGTRAVIEPAFWLGQPRTTAGTFKDYFLSILEFEPTRAADFGITHRCTIGLNPKESNDEALAEEVLEMLPTFLERPNCVAVGELGFDEITPAEQKALEAQIELAKKYKLPILVHTPHRDKARGTILIMDILKDHDIPPNQAVVDHSTEETTKSILERGFWAGHTVYPQTKLTPDRFANIFKEFGIERILLNTSADWGKSDPLLLQKTTAYLERRGAKREQLQHLVWDNPISFFGKDRLNIPADGEPFDPVAANQTHSSLRKGFDE